MEGNAQRSDTITRLKVQGIALKKVLKKLPAQTASLMSFLGIVEDCTMDGELQFVPRKTFAISNGEIHGHESHVTIAGQVDLERGKSRFSFAARNLALLSVQQALSKSQTAQKQLANQIALPPGTNITLSGTADVSGQYEISAGHESSGGTVQLKTARIGGGGLSAGNLTGKIRWDKDHVDMDRLAGTMGDGTFAMSGVVSTGPHPALDMRLSASHLDLKQLSALLTMFKVRLPILAENQLYGRVKELTLNVSGTPASPKVFFRAVPEDLCYQPPGMVRSFSERRRGP